MPLTLLNQPYIKLNWYPTQNIICSCETGMVYFYTLMGIGNRVVCMHCGKRYHIAKMNPDGTTEVVMELPTE